MTSEALSLRPPPHNRLLAAQETTREAAPAAHATTEHSARARTTCRMECRSGAAMGKGSAWHKTKQGEEIKLPQSFA